MRQSYELQRRMEFSLYQSTGWQVGPPFLSCATKKFPSAMLNPRGLLGDVLGHALPFFYGIIPVSTNKISILYFLYVLFGIIGTTILQPLLEYLCL